MTPDTLRALIEQRITELEVKHGSAESCGWHPDLAYHYDMEAAAALNELIRLREALLASPGAQGDVSLNRPHREPADCPAWHDHCHCTVKTLIHNIKRADDANDALTAAQQRIRELEQAIEDFNRNDHDCEGAAGVWHDSYLEAKARAEAAEQRIRELEQQPHVAAVRAHLEAQLETALKRLGHLNQLNANLNERAYHAMVAKEAAEQRVTALEAQNAWMREQPLNRPHADPAECPSYYDGCNCTVESLAASIEAHAETSRKLAEAEQRERTLREMLRTLVLSATDDLHVSASRLADAKRYLAGIRQEPT